MLPLAMAAPTLAGEARDERFMRCALALGHRHLGLTWPNPSVGAVIVRDEPDGPRLVGQGITQAGGRPHAERIALEAAGDQARGGTLYVSLEPCAHHGKTPPCTEAIAAAGIARLVTALEDPDPRVSGKGHQILRTSGIAVETGILAPEAARLHRGHMIRVSEGRPAVTLKLARTRDGFAARAGGSRLMITGPAANARVHLMRAHADAVVVGIDTVLADDPLLTVRLPGLERRSPVRVVIDSRLRTPLAARIVAGGAEAPTWVVTTAEAPEVAERELLAAGVQVLRVAGDRYGRVDLVEAFRRLASQGITRVFCEGGPRLAAALEQAGLIDDIVLVTGAETLDESGIPALAPDLARRVTERFRTIVREQAGDDVIESFERAA